MGLIQLFPLARSLNRRLTLLCGPTNSGKTYRAFELSRQSSSVAYLAPLRLLALEGQEKLKSLGFEASLLTGEEQDIQDDRYLASTVEMCRFNRITDVAILDETQMIMDHDRGPAFSSALVGVPAQHVIMTGSPEIEPIVRRIAAAAGEPLEVIRTERLAPLVVDTAPLKEKSIPKGSALICFSRRDIFRNREYYERRGYKVSVIYGALGPEVRREEARRFAAGETNLLIATDSIGMGLNLPITKVIFSTLIKYDGTENRILTPSEIRQIAGRAGRYGIAEEGTVGTFNKSDLERLKSVLSKMSMHTNESPKSEPTREQILAHVEKSGSFETAWIELIAINECDIFKKTNRDRREIARHLDRSFLTIQEKIIVFYAPEDASLVLMFIRSLELKKDSIHLNPNNYSGIAETEGELQSAETDLKRVTLYGWFHLKFPELFSRIGLSREIAGRINAYIIRSFRSGKIGRKCRSCNRRLKPECEYPICQDCYEGMHGW